MSIYGFVHWVLDRIQQYTNWRRKKELAPPDDSFRGNKSKKIDIRKLELGKSYRIIWKDDTSIERLSEIDKMIMFFTGELTRCSLRPESMLSNKEEYILTIKRNGYDTKTGQRYIHLIDILESEIESVNLVD
jgi:hypothetical protein